MGSYVSANVYIVTFHQKWSLTLTVHKQWK